MSEYQYYEFRAIDRPLNEEQMAELRALSTRATITPTSFVNTYSWGDFRGDPNRLVEKYFDAFVYVANWGSHHLMFRIPRRLIDVETASLYETEDSMAVRAKSACVVLGFYSEQEPDDWEEGERWLASLIPLRAEILAGDLRSLYLAWLLSVGDYEVDEDAIEPPVPPGLQRLSASLTTLVEFLRIDDDLIAVAAQRSADDQEQLTPSEDELMSWIRSLEDPEKDSLLLRMARGDEANLRWEIIRRLREDRGKTSPARDDPASAPRRTVRELLKARDIRAEQRQRRIAEQKAKDEARREREQAAARQKYLDDLEPRQAMVWQQVEAMIRTTTPKQYDEAVGLLKDLRDLALRSGSTDEVTARIRQLRERHGRKPSLLRRLDEAGLGAAIR